MGILFSSRKIILGEKCAVSRRKKPSKCHKNVFFVFFWKYSRLGEVDIKRLRHFGLKNIK